MVALALLLAAAAHAGPVVSGVPAPGLPAGPVFVATVEQQLPFFISNADPLLPLQMVSRMYESETVAPRKAALAYLLHALTEPEPANVRLPEALQRRLAAAAAKIRDSAKESPELEQEVRRIAERVSGTYVSDRKALPMQSGDAAGQLARSATFITPEGIEIELDVESPAPAALERPAQTTTAALLERGGKDLGVGVALLEAERRLAAAASASAATTETLRESASREALSYVDFFVQGGAGARAMDQASFGRVVETVLRPMRVMSDGAEPSVRGWSALAASGADAPGRPEVARYLAELQAVSHAVDVQPQLAKQSPTSAYLLRGYADLLRHQKAARLASAGADPLASEVRTTLDGVVRALHQAELSGALDEASRRAWLVLLSEQPAEDRGGKGLLGRLMAPGGRIREEERVSVVRRFIGVQSDLRLSIVTVPVAKVPVPPTRWKLAAVLALLVLLAVAAGWAAATHGSLLYWLNPASLALR